MTLVLVMVVHFLLDMLTFVRFVPPSPVIDLQQFGSFSSHFELGRCHLIIHFFPHIGQPQMFHLFTFNLGCQSQESLYWARSSIQKLLELLESQNT